MKYYIAEGKDKLILFKVSNELVAAFEKEHNHQVIVHGESIMEVLLAFEQSDDPRKHCGMETESVKYRNRNSSVNS